MNRRDAVTLAIASMAGLSAWLAADLARATAKPRVVNGYATAARSMLDQIDVAQTEDHDTLAMVARARAALGDDPDSLDGLWDLRYPGGWGLAEAWDGFGDGSINPPGTAYAVTTARAGIAFQEHGQLERAEAAADALLSMWDGVDIDYSTSDADRAYTVWNVQGVAVDLLRRLGRSGAIGDRIVARLGAFQGKDGAAAWNWRYQIKGLQDDNDVTHFASIAFPMEEAGDRTVTVGYRLFTLPGGKTKRHHTDAAAVTSGRDPGWNLALLSRRTSDADLAVQVADDLVGSLKEGRSSYARSDRDQAHLAYGLAVYAASLPATAPPQAAAIRR